MLEKLKQSFITTESKVKTRVAEKAKILQLNSLSWTKKVAASYLTIMALNRRKLKSLHYFWLTDKDSSIHKTMKEDG
jgi:hypothetical protein